MTRIKSALSDADPSSFQEDKISYEDFLKLWDETTSGKADGDFKPNTYGEITIESLSSMLSEAKASREYVVYDLGSGTGTTVIQAVLEFGVGKAVGIEMNRDRHRLACSSVETLPGLMKLGGADIHQSHASAIHGDILKFLYYDATIIFVSSLLFPEKMLAALVGRFRMLKGGTQVFMLTKLKLDEAKETGHLELKQVINVEM